MCYTVPIAASVVTTAIWLKNRDPRVGYLNLMLYGASLFGFIDHLWNGELFLISDDLAKDLLLGGVITFSVFAAWLAGLYAAKRRISRKPAYDRA